MTSRIAVVTYPFNVNVAAERNLAYLIHILQPLSSRIITITGSFSGHPDHKVRIIRLKIRKKEEANFIIRMLTGILADLQICLNLLKISRKIDIVIFQIGARAYLLSVLTSKLLRKKVVIFSFSMPLNLAKSAKAKGNIAHTINLMVTSILTKLTSLLADQIAVESESVITFSGLQKYKSKISIYGAQYIDTNLFNVRKELKDRSEIVGYIGALTPMKGVKELVKAFPLVLKRRNNVKFLMCGDGVLYNEVIKELRLNGIHDKVKMVGWIPHNEVPNYLNELKLLVLPSYSEGIPGIIQEAMACGTPVLATSVGGIPDLIKDGETGFIMKDNSPECIAKNIVRALEHPNLSRIVENARKLIERNYTYEAMVDKCEQGLGKLVKKRKTI